jgi:hypothetical protein
VAFAVGAALVLGTTLIGATRARSSRQAVVDARREIDALRLEIGVERGGSIDSIVAARKAELAAAIARDTSSDPVADSRRFAARLVVEAERLGLDVDHLAVESAAGTLTVGVSGAVASSVAWIAELSATRDAVRTMTIVPEPGGSAKVTAVLGAPVGDADSTAEDTPARDRRVADGGLSGSWPAATPRSMAQALWIPSRAESPVDPMAPDSRVVTRGLPPPAHIGTITTPVGQRFAFRLPESGVVCLLTPGESAFGWRLASVSSTRFGFTKEGVNYEVLR